MSNYFLLKYLAARIKEYIFIILTAIILVLTLFSKSFSDENVFIVDNVEAKGPIDLNFSRDKYINKAFLDSFEILMSKVLLTRDLEKIEDINLRKIKNLINSFQILEESHQNNEYKAKFKIYYNDRRVKTFLSNNNVLFSEPKKISAVFYPILFVNGELQSLKENYFYNQWNNIKIKNELINFVLPLEDLDDISKIKKMKNKLEYLQVDDLVNKYDLKNYAFALMTHNRKDLKIHVKTNFNNNKTSKNIYFKIENIDNESDLNLVLENLKTVITDIWKELNIVNLLMPLSIKVRFNQKNLSDLDELKKNLYKISTVDSYNLEEFNTDHSIFKIYYYGNPKRLTNELLKFNYQLKDDLGYWELYSND